MQIAQPFRSRLLRAERRRTAGFSLVELMCAILILGFGLVGLMHGITTAVSSTKESELQTGAAMLAAGRIELLRADGYLFEGEDAGEYTGDLARYRWKQTVTGTDIDGLYEVKVVVEHSESKKPIYELQTLLFDPPFVSTLEQDEESERDQRMRRRRMP